MTVSKHLTASLQEIAAQLDAEGPAAFFTAEELEQYSGQRSLQRLAVRFLAKKIILNHAGTAPRFLDISILNDTFGSPLPEISGKTAAALRAQNIKQVRLSLSHAKMMATAFVVFEYLYSNNSKHGTETSNRTLGDQG